MTCVTSHSTHATPACRLIGYWQATLPAKLAEAAPLTMLMAQCRTCLPPALLLARRHTWALLQVGLTSQPTELV